MSSRGMPVTQQVRKERREKADFMKKEYSLLSTEEKLARLPRDGAKKQRKRLEGQLAAEKNPSSEKKT